VKKPNAYKNTDNEIIALRNIPVGEPIKIHEFKDEKEQQLFEETLNADDENLDKTLKKLIKKINRQPKTHGETNVIEEYPSTRELKEKIRRFKNK
jgi:hypothetical protein